MMLLKTRLLVYIHIFVNFHFLKIFLSEGAPRAQVGEDRAGYRRGFGGPDKKGEAGAGADTQFQFVSD